MKSDIDMKQFELESFMEDEDDKATAAALAEEAQQQEKCDHGVYIAQGDSFARYCTACNPGHGRIMTPPSRVPKVTHHEHTLDAVEYSSQPLYERLAFAAQLEDISA